MQKKTSTKTIALNIAFGVSLIAILVFLLSAPEKSTSPLPHDDIHAEFFAIKSKKEASKNCTSCHNPDGPAPLAADHPTKYRCLLCHERK